MEIIDRKTAEIVAGQIKFNGVKEWDRLSNDLDELVTVTCKVMIDNACKAYCKSCGMERNGCACPNFSKFKETLEELSKIN